jgi:hypothetical protein
MHSGRGDAYCFHNIDKSNGRLMAERIFEAITDQVLHVLLAHVAEGHRRPGFVALFGHVNPYQTLTC